MPAKKIERNFKPHTIFIGYTVIACLVVLIFRLIYPGEISPLPEFSKNWRLNKGLLDIIALFPAIAFSALVVPFGRGGDEAVFERFSPMLFQRLVSPIVIAISAAAVYTLLFFVVLPMSRGAEENMRFRGELFSMAKQRAQEHAAKGEWLEASQFIGICDTAWLLSPDIAALRTDVEIHLDESRYRLTNKTKIPAGVPAGASVSALPGQREPVDAAEALALGRAAFDDKKFFDAHWLATLGGRIARDGSPEKTRAARQASEAWNEIESLGADPRETAARSVFRIKLSGYQAMLSGDWIRAYYIFLELNNMAPGDPDTENFLKASEKGTLEIAFFVDEIDVSLKETFTGVLFSLPAFPDGPGRSPGRSVMRLSGFSSTQDYAYGVGIEYMVFGAPSGQPVSLWAPYAKFLPITIDGEQRVLALMRALDRDDSGKRWEPEWNIQNNNASLPHDLAQVILSIDFETFLMLSGMRHGLNGLQMFELFAASNLAAGTGYISEVFEAEILNRLGSCFFFLPVSIITLILGLRLRAQRRPRYIFPLLLPVLPVVFYGLDRLCRITLNTIGTSLIFAMGFSTAFIIFIVILVFSFILSLILLAAYRS